MYHKHKVLVVCLSLVGSMFISKAVLAATCSETVEAWDTQAISDCSLPGNCTESNQKNFGQTDDCSDAGMICCGINASTEKEKVEKAETEKADKEKAEAAANALPTFPDPLNGAGVSDVIRNIITKVLGLVGTLFFVMFLWGGFQYITSAGEKGDIDKAKKTLVNAVIGIIIIGTSYAIVSNIVRILGSSRG